MNPNTTPTSETPPQLPCGDRAHVRGAQHPPLIESTIGELLAATAARWPEREALVVRHQDIRLNYAELKAQVDTVAARLLALGLEPGDRIGIWAPNCVEWVLTQLAAARAGLILVTINPAYRRHELEHALNKVGCRALVLAPSFKSSDYLAILESLAPELRAATPGELKAQALPQLQFVIRTGSQARPGMMNFERLLAPVDEAARQHLESVAATLVPNQPINIQFTSGTTGAPKGASLTHRNILNNGFFVGEAMRLTEADRLCIPVPLYHCFGMVMGVLACVTHGACMVFPCEGFDPAAVLAAVQAERCTALHGVPTMFVALLDHPDFGNTDFSTLRTGIMAGSPCPIEVMRKVVDRMHMGEITIAYGMTETSPVSFQSSIDDPLERRVTTVGRIQPHLEAKIVDEHGNTARLGEPGEILIRGYSTMSGYWNDAPATAKAIDKDGFMHTGDLGTIDDEGFCNIIGRAKDVVIRGGENIYPREVEEFLYLHPAVQSVQCVGVPDAKYGEELCACIVPNAGHDVTEADIRAFCKNQIAHYKIPRYIRFVEAFPTTVTGKVQKFAMRAELVKALGLEEIRTA